MTNGLPASVDQFFDEGAEAETFGRVYFPFFVSGFQEGIQNVRLGTRRADDKVFTDYVKLALKRKAFTHASWAVGTTKEKMRTLLQQAVEEGWGIEEFGRAIRKTFEIEGKIRALRIARTELTDTINDGSNQTLKSEGYQQKEWSTVIDGQERPTHHAANGQTVGIHDVFKVGGYSALYPGDENLPPEERINCRCALVGAGMTDGRKQQLGKHFLRVHGSLEKKFVVSLSRAFRQQRDRILAHLP